MSDQIPAPVPDSFAAQMQAYEQRAAELHPANKASLMAALRDAGITCVTVTFDGYGDSGQIENVEVKAGDSDAELPTVDVDIARTEFCSEEVQRLNQPLPDAIETMSYVLLEEKHGGWENNEGAMATSSLTSPPTESCSTSTTGSRRPKTTPTSSEEAIMGHCYHHALSSMRKWGGRPENYLPIHQWFDEPSKLITADFRHRALRHHAEGVFMLERFFGAAITISTGRVVPVRLIGEQHILEDLGFIPSFADWVRCIRPEPWMGRAQPIHKLVDPFAVPEREAA